ncbi:hypothetical protein D3C86_1751530 [compost metagenome]
MLLELERVDAVLRLLVKRALIALEASHRARCERGTSGAIVARVVRQDAKPSRQQPHACRVGVVALCAQQKVESGHVRTPDD